VSAPDPALLPDMVPPLDNLELRELGDSFAALRMGRLRHNAIDIMRPLGDPLVAVVDGMVEKLHNSRLGGISLYLLDSEKRYRFYYAHLDRYAEGIVEGRQVRKGDLLGYVGKTGNARWTAPHLHFQVMTTEPTGSWWKAAQVLNPYPILRDLVQRQLAGIPRPFVGPPLAGPIDTSADAAAGAPPGGETRP
jgi:murein DD-endopeptidase MepM/ murein hydrolase activator NlpD